MTEVQFGLLLGAISGLGALLVGALRWAVNRVTKSNDDGTAAIIANTASNAVLVTKIDGLARAMERLDDFVKEEISGVHDGPPKPGQRFKTPVRGTRAPRPGTFHDTED
jgi:hypothetical protein